MRKTLLLVLVLLAAAGGGYWWWKSSRAPAGPRVLATATIAEGRVRKVLQATGIIKAQVGAIVKVGTRATGRLDKMPVKVGDRVQKGDLMAVIDDRELRAQREEALAKLAQAQAELARVEEVYPLQVREAEADLKVTQAQAQYSGANFERQRQLFERGLVPRDALEQAEQTAAVNRNQQEARRATLARLQSEYRQQLQKARKALEEARANAETIDVRLTYTRVYSPISGVVSQVTIQEGETVVAGLQVANLVTVLDPSRLEMWIYVDETDVGQVSRSMPVEFRVDSYPDRTFGGTIDQIYPQPEIRDNIVYYQALVRLAEDQAELLRPEMTTQVQIIVAVKDGVLALPNEALKWVGDKQVVYVSTGDDQYRQVRPTLGLQGLAFSEILDGLAKGDVVATQLVLPERADGAKSGQRPGGQGGGPGGPGGGPGGGTGSGSGSGGSIRPGSGGGSAGGGSGGSGGGRGQ